jgi:hypothetical protein
MRVFIPKHLCWHPDIPDFRDLAPESQEILKLLPDAKLPQHDLPDSVNISEFLLSYPITSSATACPSSIVCTKLVEYFNNRCAGRIEPLCARFVTQAVTTLTRGDCSGIRANLKAIRKFGIPSNSITEAWCEWDDYFSHPISFGDSDEFKSMHYFRLSNQFNAASPVPLLKTWLASGFPVAFGFSVPSSLDCDGYIEFRPTFDSIQGGHAALLVGFDDKQLAASRGAFRVYCPWGDDWGDQGFGWLPYKIAERRMALDFWTIIKPEWAASGELFRST